MTAFWSGTTADFLATAEAEIIDRLTHAQVRRFRTTPFEQLRAWSACVGVLQGALAALPEAACWRVLLEFELLRLGRRIDALLVTPRGGNTRRSGRCPPSSRRHARSRSLSEKSLADAGGSLIHSGA